MISFLFEQYGYYPKMLENNCFFIDGWKFMLVEVDGDEDYVDEIAKYSNVVRDAFDGEGPYIINNRYNKRISYYDGKKYVLISVHLNNVTYQKLNKFHLLFNDQNKSVNLQEIMLSWKDRMDFIERECISSLPVDDVYYSHNLEITMFCLGLCQNAIQYMSDAIMDYGKDIKNVSLTHKRICDLNSFDFYNPFNFIVDYPLRDYIELYRNDFLQFEEMIDVLQYYEIDLKLASLFIARVMYPVNIFDSLEKIFISRDKNTKLEYNIQKEINKIKKVYAYFKEKYHIRPIIWLESNYS